MIDADWIFAIDRIFVDHPILIFDGKKFTFPSEPSWMLSSSRLFSDKPPLKKIITSHPGGASTTFLMTEWQWKEARGKGRDYEENHNDNVAADDDGNDDCDDDTFLMAANKGSKLVVFP